MRREFIKNSASGAFQSIISVILVFFTIPVFIKMLGSEAYGVWSLVMVVGNLNVFANLGLNTTLVKFIAEQGKTEESNYDIVVSLLIMVAVSIPLVLLAIILKQFILENILNIPSSLISEAGWLFIFLVFANLFILLGQTFTATLDALQKIYLTNALRVFYSCTYWGLILFVLLLGRGLPAVGLMCLIAALVWFIVAGTITLKQWGPIKLKGITANFARITRKQISYGIQVYASSLIGFFYEPFTKILISHFIGVTEVGFFNIALSVKGHLWGLMGKVLYPVYPLLSQLKDPQKVRLIVHDLSQKIFYLVIPLTVVLNFTMMPFIQLWIGENIQVISLSVMGVLSAHLLFSITILPTCQYLTAKGLASRFIIIQIVNVAVNTAIFFATLPVLGYYAVIVANMGAIYFSFMLALHYQKRYLNSLIFDNYNQILKLLLIALLMIIIFLPVNIVVGNPLLKLIIVPGTGVILTLWLYRGLRVLSKEDVYRYLGNDSILSKRVTSLLIKS